MLSHAVIEFGATCELRHDFESGLWVGEDHFLRQAGQCEANELPKAHEPDGQGRKRMWMPAMSRRRERRRSAQRHISLSEFAYLEDGRRVLIRNDRGWTDSSRHAGRTGAEFDREEIESYARSVLRSEESGYSAEWLCPRLKRLYNITVYPESVAAAWDSDLVIEFGEKLEAALQSRMRSTQ